jgi:hypothetical protein
MPDPVVHAGEQIAWQASYEAARMLLSQMREIEERVLDPGARWDVLRGVLTRLVERAAQEH